MEIRKHIPNAITCCNLLCGCIAVMAAFSGQYEMSFAFIIAGGVFDFFDGFIARLLHVSSPIGKELDSLADVITFGLAPSTMIWSILAYLVRSTDSVALQALPLIAFVMTAFSALRLAKFNLDERQSSGFIGMPTPANALFWSSLIVGAQAHIEQSSHSICLLPLGVIIASFLLVSEIPMFALKFKNYTWADNKLKYLFIITAILLIATLRSAGFAAVIVWYVLLSLLAQKKTKQD